MVEPPPPSNHFRMHPDRALLKGREWVSHSGRKQRLRYLRQQLHKLLVDKDNQPALDRLREITKDEPEPEYAFLNLLHGANNATEDTGTPIAESIDYIINKFSELKAEK